MKTHEITTSKGEFVVASLTTREERGVDCNPMLNLICKLSEATEEDAKLVVDNPLYSHCSDCDECLITECKKHTNPYLDRLHSLLTSKGIDINNGNWYLFKKV